MIYICSSIVYTQQQKHNVKRNAKNLLSFATYIYMNYIYTE